METAALPAHLLFPKGNLAKVVHLTCNQRYLSTQDTFEAVLRSKNVDIDSVTAYTTRPRENLGTV